MTYALVLTMPSGIKYAVGEREKKFTLLSVEQLNELKGVTLFQSEKQATLWIREVAKACEWGRMLVNRIKPVLAKDLK